MNRDDIIRMAREARLPACHTTHPVALERFAVLVAAAERERLTVDGIHSCHAKCQRPVCRLTRERDALLEALRPFALGWSNDLAVKARDAIAAAEGQA